MKWTARRYVALTWVLAMIPVHVLVVALCTPEQARPFAWPLGMSIGLALVLLFAKGDQP